RGGDEQERDHPERDAPDIDDQASLAEPAWLHPDDARVARQAREEPLEEPSRREGHRAERLRRIEVLAAERPREGLAPRSEGAQERGRPAARRIRRRSDRGEPSAPSARHTEKITVRSDSAGSPARSWRPSARPRAIPARSLPAASVARARSSAAAAHQGSQAAAAEEFRKAEPNESIVPEKAKATPATNAAPPEIESRRASARAPKNAQRTCSR